MGSEMCIRDRLQFYLCFSAACRLCTKSAQSRGPENIDPERPLPGRLAPTPVFSPSRITLENNGKIWPQPDRENAFAGASGGGGGIRTHGGRSPTSVFKTGALNHSATPPAGGNSVRGPRDQAGVWRDFAAASPRHVVLRAAHPGVPVKARAWHWLQAVRAGAGAGAGGPGRKVPALDAARATTPGTDA